MTLKVFGGTGLPFSILAAVPLMAGKADINGGWRKAEHTRFVTTFHLAMLTQVVAGAGLNKEDWLHHLISGMGVPVVGIAVPYGKVLSLVNFFMCGLPGTSIGGALGLLRHIWK
eukprot:677783-Rhodomonas_salina.2